LPATRGFEADADQVDGTGERSRQAWPASVVNRGGPARREVFSWEEHAKAKRLRPGVLEQPMGLGAGFLGRPRNHRVSEVLGVGALNR
jgi:hypothetical protein